MIHLALWVASALFLLVIAWFALGVLLTIGLLVWEGIKSEFRRTGDSSSNVSQGHPKQERADSSPPPTHRA